MTVYKIHYRSEGVRNALKRLQARAGDMGPAFRDIGEYLIASTKARFAKGVAPDGSAWAPKSQTTIDAYRARGEGALTRPLIGPASRLSSEITYRARGDGVTVGSSLIYSAVQQFGAAAGAFGKTRRGAPIPWGRIPARPFLGLSRDDERNVVDIIEEHLDPDSDG